MGETTEERKRRKEDARQKKRQRIEAAGGVRPREVSETKDSAKGNQNSNAGGDARGSNNSSYNNNGNSNYNNNGGYNNNHQRKDHRKRKDGFQQRSRFGRVMETVPCRNRPRYSTLSIAVPGSVLSNCQTRELKTLMVGQIARAATIYHADEIIVFDDKLGKDQGRDGYYRPGGWKRRDHRHNNDRERSSDRGENSNSSNNNTEAAPTAEDEPPKPRFERSTPQEFMARLLQYCECPQYLRRNFFPMHPDLQFAGLLAPVDAPHHVRANDKSKYREGVVMDKKGANGGSMVNCGIRSRPVEIDRALSPGIRCTVQLNPKDYDRPGLIRGTVVSPSAPREDDGTYWGYITRMASSISDIFEQCPFGDAYDLKIGTSERGDRSIEDKQFRLPKYEHALVVFGGVAGIEECVDADESLKLPGAQSKALFDIWLNTCPYQASRTIRTEEAVLISLTALSAPLIRSARDTELEESSSEEDGNGVEFSDEDPSDESSEEE